MLAHVHSVKDMKFDPDISIEKKSQLDKSYYLINAKI